MGGFELFRGDALDAYRTWPAPATIISDGAYGVRGFHGDTTGSVDLPHWYRPHVEAWSAAAGPASTLWFWNTEIGWASVHPVLTEYGWDYVQLIVWDKGLAHIAGNVNGRTIRQFPVVTEVCAFYQRTFTVAGPDGPMPVKQWIRHEWARSGLTLQRANEACGVKNAATRKYLTKDWLWYWPPGQMTERLAAYANAHGQPSGWPYYSLDGERPVTAKEWDALRYRWRHAHGVTNVWSRRPLHDEERLKGTLRRAAPRVYKPTPASSAHLNQKPLEFMARLITAVTDPGDVVWEPFGGLCSASVAAVALGRRAFAAETDRTFADLAEERLMPLLVIGESDRVDCQRWDQKYAGIEFSSALSPSPFVASELAGLPPGRALDLAAGHGRHTVWLAEQGWRVTAVDFSRVGLDQARKLSAARGVADLDDYQPARDAFGLVLLAYFQVGAALRAKVLAGAAAALTPGGTVLVIGHDLTNLAEGVGGPRYPEVLYTPEGITAELRGLQIVRAGRVRRTVELDDGPATAVDTLVRAERSGR
jgi:SAM-dependent methyltransferase